MADNRKYYVLCAANCKFEGMTKEQILAAITQAVENGEIKDVDTGFVTTIKEQNTGAALSFWVGTMAQYNALTEKAANCFYIITDDTSITDVQSLVEKLNTNVAENTEKLCATADFVVEQGKSEGWTYRKWQSGIAECWGVFKHTAAVKTQYSEGGFYRSEEIAEVLPDSLFKTITAANVINTRAEAIDAVYLTRVRNVTTSLINYYCIRDGKAGTATFDFYINIKGTWK